MPASSAGLLPYRRGGDGTVEVLLVHPGGPFWARREHQAWSIAKGEYASGGDPLATAEREFEEEIGRPAPDGPRVDLGEVRQAGGKRVRAWAVPAPAFEVGDVASNTFEMEWPPGSGRTATFPEVDRAAWCPLAVARQRLVAAQAAFLDRLAEHLASTGSS